MHANRIGASGISFAGDFMAHMQLMARKNATNENAVVPTNGNN